MSPPTAPPAGLAGGLLAAGLVAAACAAVGFLAAACIAASGLSARAAPADVAIVFGSKVEPSGAPSPRLAARLEEALRIYRRGLVRRILVSGAVGSAGLDEARVMERELVRAGVPDSALHADGEGANTARTAANAATYMRAAGLRSAVIVTQYFHIARARLACRRAGIAVVGASAPRFFEPRDLYSLGREVAALAVYAVRDRPAAGHLSRRPGGRGNAAGGP